MDSSRLTTVVPYGDEQITVTLPRHRFAANLQPRSVKIEDEEQTVVNALSQPLNSVAFQDFLDGPGEALVIVNDATRATPTARILPLVLKFLNRHEHKFIIATGAHRAPTRKELLKIFGRDYQALCNRILIHNARRPSEVVRLGTTAHGTEVYVNRAVTRAARLVIISSVEPHYFAGYSGGRKSIVPGLAGFETIEQNHRLALSEAARPLALSGNPVHEDLTEAVGLLGDKPIFALNLVLDANCRIFAATAGELHSSFQAATRKADEVYRVPLRSREAIVVSIARPPFDRDLYQLQKALEHGLLAVKRNGVLILVSKCYNGLGENAYMRLLEGWQTPKTALAGIHKETRFGCHKAVRFARAALWARLFAVTDLDPAVLRRLFIEPFSFLQSAIDAALQQTAPEGKILFLMNGSLTVPDLVPGRPGVER